MEAFDLEGFVKEGGSSAGPEVTRQADSRHQGHERRLRGQPSEATKKGRPKRVEGVSVHAPFGYRNVRSKR